MGYQNNERPGNDLYQDGESLLTTDIYFDLTDLKYDIKNGLPKEELLNAIDFIINSMKILTNRYCDESEKGDEK